MSLDIQVYTYVHEGQRKEFFRTSLELDENLAFPYQKTLETLRLLFPKGTLFDFNIHV